MKRLNAILGASGLILALSLPSSAQEVKQLTHTVTLSGTVETIDHDKHVMNIKSGRWHVPNGRRARKREAVR